MSSPENLVSDIHWILFLRSKSLGPAYTGGDKWSHWQSITAAYHIQRDADIQGLNPLIFVAGLQL